MNLKIDFILQNTPTVPHSRCSFIGALGTDVALVCVRIEAMHVEGMTAIEIDLFGIQKVS